MNFSNIKKSNPILQKKKLFRERNLFSCFKQNFHDERNVIVSSFFTCALFYRALDSISEHGGWENLQHEEYEFGDEYSDEYRRNGNGLYDNHVHMDDCEVFECGVATLGRKVIGAVRKFGDR